MPAAPHIAVIGTLDTKGAGIDHVAGKVREHGARPIVIDSGVLGEPSVEVTMLGETTPGVMAMLPVLRERGSSPWSSTRTAWGARRWRASCDRAAWPG